MKKKQRKALWRLAVALGLVGAGLWLATLQGPTLQRPIPPQKPGIQVQVAPPVMPAPPPAPPTAEPSFPAQIPAAGGEESAPAPAPPETPMPGKRGAFHAAPGIVPKIAIVIDDMGLDLKDSRRATDLPDYVTLSFMPYATRLREQAAAARDAGHELLLHMPMEPLGNDDPGPGALLTSLPPDELRERFDTALASFTGFDGVNNHMGSKFTAYPEGMDIVMEELKPRHLFFLDSRTGAQSVGYATAVRDGVPAISRDIFLDDDMKPAAIRHQLDEAERAARRKGTAVAIGHPHPATLDVLEQWLPQAVARGVVFVPLHDLVPASP